MPPSPAIPPRWPDPAPRATVAPVGPRHLVLLAALALEAHCQAAGLATLAAALGIGA